MITLLLSLFILFTPAPQQPDTVSSKITKATVYRSGALVTRTASVDLKKGRQKIVFNDLSIFLQRKTIQLSGEGNYVILSINSDQEYITTSTKKDGIEDLERRKNQIQRMIIRNDAKTTVQTKRLAFLNPDKLINKNEKYSTSELEEFLAFYSAQSDTIESKLIELRALDRSYKTELDTINKQLRESVISKTTQEMQIVVEIDSKFAQEVNFEISYLTLSARWDPLYDIRVESVNEPVQFIYKAAILQNSGYDWTDIELTISSSNPNENTIAPEITPWFIDFYSKKYSRTGSSEYSRQISGNTAVKGFRNSVYGRVTDEGGEGIPGVNVVLAELTKGDVTDVEGYYQIKHVPPGTYSLTASFTGYDKFHAYVTTGEKMPPINILLVEDILSLDEVIVVGYHTEAKKEVSGSVAKARSGDFNNVEINSAQSIASFSDKVSSFSYTIDQPYSIASGPDDVIAVISTNKIESSFKYAAVPKLNPHAYLLSQLTNWEDLNLIAGEANLYLEDTFIGSTVIAPSGTQDTLNLSLGSDKGIVITRKAVKDFEQRKFFGSKTRETKTFEITIRNTKSAAVRITLKDNIPIALDEGIKVSAKEISNAKYDKETGILLWDLQIESGETKTIRFTYELEYPKNKSLVY